MELKELAQAAGSAGVRIKIVSRYNKTTGERLYSFMADYPSEFVHVTKRDGGERWWRNLDTMVHHIRSNKYNGELYLIM